MKIFFKQKLFIFLCLLFSVNYTFAREGNQISIVGSSTVFPFATIVAERFYRVNEDLSRQRQGTGLGLSIVKHILNRHQGELIIESKINEGSKFTVWLPKEKDKAQAIKNAKAA